MCLQEKHKVNNPNNNNNNDNNTELYNEPHQRKLPD